MPALHAHLAATSDCRQGSARKRSKIALRFSAVGENAPSPKALAGARELGEKENFLSPLRGSNCQYRNPRLTPWATFYRCSAAICQRSQELICARARLVASRIGIKSAGFFG